MTTREDLQTAFAGESQANRKYLFFAEKADREDHPQIAHLFRAVAEAETVHARNHLEAMGDNKTTAENIETAINGENYEFTQMYPGFLEKAKAEGDKKAQLSFSWANQVEQIHYQLYQKALETIKGSQGQGEVAYYVCQTCGNTVSGQAPDRCPICGSPRSKFKRID